MAGVVVHDSDVCGEEFELGEDVGGGPFAVGVVCGEVLGPPELLSVVVVVVVVVFFVRMERFVLQSDFPAPKTLAFGIRDEGQRNRGDVDSKAYVDHVFS
jgi:hypothetical protein